MSKTRKPRILYIATFPPPVHGSTVVSMQIKNSKVINEAFDGDYVNLSTSMTTDEIGKGGIILNLKKLWRISKVFLLTFWLLLTHHYNLCYCAITIGSYCFLRDAPFVLMCKMFGRKVVIHQHNKGMSKLIDKPIYRWLYQLTYRNVKVNLLSWHLYSDIERVVKKEDVMICPNGIKPTSKLTVDSIKLRECKKTPHIFFLSNLLVDKGVLVLLDALKILKDKDYSFVCDFVGGETRDFDASRFSLEVDARSLNQLAIYHGRKYGDEKAEYFEMADIFAFPTFYSNECFPLVLLEAMEMSVACISTNEGGISDIIEDGRSGYIVPRQDPQALADAIEILLRNPHLCRSMGAASRKLFEERFTEEQFEQTLLKCLKKCSCQ